MMTIDERFDRTAGLAEERRKDREENRQLWRDTQRQINEVSVKIIQLGDELRDSDQRLGQRMEQLTERIDRLAEESHAADTRLGERIDSLVSAIGEFVAKVTQPKVD